MKTKIIIVIGMLIYILFFSSCISLEPDFTNQENYFLNTAELNDLSIYAQEPSDSVLPLFMCLSILNC